MLAGQPGFFARDDDWWGRVLHDEPGERHGAGPLRCLLAEDGSGVRGYALYATRERWDDATGLPDGELTVRELVAADPAAGAALWQNLLDRDLIASVIAELRPADDPLLHQLLDQRRARERLADGIWVRIIDLPAALSRRALLRARSTWCSRSPTRCCPATPGRWRLRGRRAGRRRRLRADAAARRPGARRPRARRGLPRRHPARHARPGRAGPRAAARRARRLVRRDDLGPGALVPADLLGAVPRLPADNRAMAVTKITLSTAMRARDVSRPRAEHLAEAAEREEAATRQPEPARRPPAPPGASAGSPRPRRRAAARPAGPPQPSPAAGAAAGGAAPGAAAIPRLTAAAARRSSRSRRSWRAAWRAAPRRRTGSRRRPSRTTTASSWLYIRAPRLSTFASLCWRASRAVSVVQASAARMPGTLFAAICSPLPEPPITMPRLPGSPMTPFAARST